MQTLSPEFSQANSIFLAALNFDLGAVTERYVKTYNVPPDVAQLHEIECKRYLVLCALFPKEKLGMQGPVDNYWHTFLLFTKEYTQFCQNVANNFIHHVPTRPNSHDGSSFIDTMNRYRNVFGIEPNAQAWPHACSKADCTECSSGPGPGDCAPSKDCSGGPSCDKCAKCQSESE